jgi:GT2 family glycosyltransferase
LVAPLINRQAALSYARQLPHPGAGIFERFPREFNYPPETQFRGVQDIERYGVYTCFCSDSCAAYDNRALDAIGGFPKAAFGEDTIVAAKLLLQGRTIAYVAEAQVFHSHSYNLKEEFCRHLAIGYYRKAHEGLFRQFGSDRKRGFCYVQSLLQRLFMEKPWLIPYALVQTFVKGLGYFLGRSFLLLNRVPYQR